MRRYGLAITLVLVSISFVAANEGRDADVSPAAARDCLESWARCSQVRPPVDLDQYVARYERDYSVAMLRVASAFFGAVDADRLQDVFRWTIVAANESEIRLRATPRTLDRLATRAVAGGPSSAAPLASAAAELTGPGRVDDALECAFEIVIDRRLSEPRLVHCLDGRAGVARDAVERLAPDNLIPAEEETISGRHILAHGGRDVVPASALIQEQQNSEADPALLETLSRWEQAASQLRSTEIAFRRIDYDNIFELETRGVGRFVFVAPNKGLYELKGAPVVDRADLRSSPRGGNFLVNSAKPELLWWTGDSVTIIDAREKTFNELQIPRPLRSDVQAVGSWDVIWQVLAGPQKALPAVVAIQSELLVSRFEWKLIPKSDTQILLEGRPRSMADRRHISRLDVILDPGTYRTTATHVVDPSGSRETVHVFEYRRVNDPQLENVDDWKPDLSGLSPLGPPPLAPPAAELPAAPPSQP